MKRYILGWIILAVLSCQLFSPFKYEKPETIIEICVDKCFIYVLANDIGYKNCLINCYEKEKKRDEKIYKKSTV